MAARKVGSVSKKKTALKANMVMRPEARPPRGGQRVSIAKGNRNAGHGC